MTKEEFRKKENENAVIYKCEELYGKVVLTERSATTSHEVLASIYEATKEQALKAYIAKKENLLKRCKDCIKQAEEIARKNKISLTKAEQDAVIKEDTQWYRVIKYLEEYKSISPREAFTDLGITKLATRISELRSRGFKFKQKREPGQNRYGELVYYMRYWLDEGEEENAETAV